MKDMKGFLTKLADLMEEYDVEMEAREGEGGYYTYVDGIDFEIQSKYEDGVLINEYELVETGRYLDAKDIRAEVGNI